MHVPDIFTENLAAKGLTKAKRWRENAKRL
jgi:hypothetical protein